MAAAESNAMELQDYSAAAQNVDFRNAAVDRGVRKQRSNDRPVKFEGQKITREVLEEHVLNSQDHFHFQAEVREKIIEVPKIVEEIVEKEVEVPEVHIMEVVKEVPQIKQVVKRVPKYEFNEVEVKVPKKEVQVIEKYVEVPELRVRNMTVEVQHLQEVVRSVPRIQVIDVPVERPQIKKKVIYMDVEEIQYVPVPFLVPNPSGQSHPLEQSFRMQVNRNGGQIPQKMMQILSPAEGEVEEFVPQYVDVPVDEMGLPTRPAGTLQRLLQSSAIPVG